MWKKLTTIGLLVLLINFTSGSGIASLSCPFDDDPDDPTLLPYIGDCTKFFKCSYGKAYTLSCPRGLHWSNTLARCEAPKVALCDASATTTKPVPGGTGCDFIYKPHPTDCSKVIQCASGVLTEISCPEGALWDRTTNKCSFGTVVCY